MMIKKKISQTLHSIMDRLGIVRTAVNRNDRRGMVHKAWAYVVTNLLEGAYYEFGLYQGDTLVDSWKEYQQFRKWIESQTVSGEQWRRKAIQTYQDVQHPFYGFDTFEGIPDNDEGNTYFQKGTFACGLDKVKKRMDKHGVQARLFKNKFADVDPKDVASLQPAVIVNIDADLYLSARDALGLVKDKFQQGTILLMDDYHCFAADNQKGERRALKEFCAQNPQFSFEPWMPYQFVGQSFICHVNRENG